MDVAYRFKRIAKSIGAEDLATAKIKIRNNVTGITDAVLREYLNDLYDADLIRGEIINATANALAEFIFRD